MWGADEVVDVLYSVHVQYVDGALRMPTCFFFLFSPSLSFFPLALFVRSRVAHTQQTTSNRDCWNWANFLCTLVCTRGHEGSLEAVFTA